MTTGEAGVQGAQPKVEHGTGNPEVFKYTKLWADHPEYRMVSPGEQLAQHFLDIARPKPGASIIDFGCGTGRGGLQLAVVGQLNVTMIDFARNCLDADIVPMLETQKHVLRFIKADLEKRIPATAEYGFCTDVMEHIPTDKVDDVLSNILASAQHVFFQIALFDDICGSLIGEKLHLTIQSYEWWLKRFKDRECTVHWSSAGDPGPHGAQVACFYVSAWMNGRQLVDAGVLNVEDQSLRDNCKINIENGWKQIQAHPTNEIEVMILGGGPSLAKHEDEIREHRKNGLKLITMNGAYNWCLEKGLKPSAQIIVDAREFNKRFTKPVDDACTYLIASQCHPSVLEGLPKERTFLWHTMADIIGPVLSEHYKEGWFGVPGGPTVLTRAIPLMRILGYQYFHLYGCDSCIVGHNHHAYSQTENDRDMAINVTVSDGSSWRCHAWMIAQAQQFIDMIQHQMGETFKVEVHGGGLLAHILETGAKLQDLRDETPKG